MNCDYNILGANVVVGGDAPISGLIAGLGHAATVLVNEQHSDVLAVPSTSVIKGKDTILVIGESHEIMEVAMSSKSTLFGAYQNILSADGISAMWNGYIGASDKSKVTSVPQVSVGGNAAVMVDPINLASFPKQVIIFESGAKKGNLSVDEAVKRIVNLTDEGKAEAAMALLKKVEIKIVGSVADLKSML